MRRLAALLLSVILAYSVCGCSVQNTYSQYDTTENKTEYLTNEFESYNTQPTDFLWEEDESGIIITKYIGDSERVRTPQKINGKPVTQIGNGAFTTDIIEIALNDNPSIDDWVYETKYGNAKSIIISEGVEIIGDFAFSNAQIKEVSLPSTITVLGEKSFFESSVELIELSSDSPVIIGEKAFQHCSNLKKIQIDKIKRLNWDAVYYCEKLECISGIDEETELIGEHPVDSDVFCECRRLNAVKSGNWWYRIINDEAYISDYSGVETKLVIPDTIDGYIVKGIGKSAFGSLDEGYEPQKTGMRYTEIIMPDTIEIIEPYAFDCCEELVNIYISCNLKSIGDNAFRGCNNLKKIIIPNSIDEIGDILGWTETKEKVEIIYISEPQTIPESQTNETIVSFGDSVESDEYVTIQGNRIEKGCKELSLYTVGSFEYQVYDNTIQLDSPLSVDDIEKLAQLSELKSLCCSSCGIEDISFLENLKCVELLDLSGNRISDISVLSELTNLKELILSNNLVSDVSSLQSLEELRYLNLSYTRFQDVSMLSNFEYLKSLDISCNEILNIEELGNLNNLTKLSVSKTGIDNLEFIKSMDHLTYLAATLNDIKDISILSDKSKLAHLYLDGNPIEDYSQLDKLNLVDCDLK